MGNEATYFLYFPSITPARSFYANAGQEIESTARFRKIWYSKTKELLHIIRCHDFDAFQSRNRWEISGFTFPCLGKVRDSSLALRALNSMGGISLSRLPSISLISRSEHEARSLEHLWALQAKFLSLSRISLSRTKYLVPRMRFQVNFLSLSRTFKMTSIMNFLSSKFSFLNATKWRNSQRNTIALCYFK